MAAAITDPETGVTPAPRRRGLRTGYTTGACAAAATRAACLALEGHRPEVVEVPLPAGVTAAFPIHMMAATGCAATASVIKDAGDDPDVTHGAEVWVRVEAAGVAKLAAGEWSVTEHGAAARQLGSGLTLELRAGDGVGVVTRAGLGLPVDGPAINPVPRRMIARAVRECLASPAADIRVTVGVRDGERLALKTLNGRLGIEGGLSILGTTGVVRPYSTAAWRASVLQGVDVAAAAGCRMLVASTGGRSETFARAVLSGLPETAFVEMGEFTGHLLKRARERGMAVVYLAGMVGKLSKIARGHFMTHVAGSQVDVGYLAGLARRAGGDSELDSRISTANSARHAQELAQAAGLDRFFVLLAAEAARSCQNLVGRLPEVRVLCFDFDGALLGSSQW